jgi:uncharacterized coiled-coil DUF342 family protein
MEKFDRLIKSNEIIEITKEIDKYKNQIENLSFKISELIAQGASGNASKIEKLKKEIQGIKEKILILEEKRRLENERLKN